MSGLRFLVSGSHGFIGGHVALALREYGEVVEFEGDVCDRSAWETQLAEVDVVAHLAGRVGTGESMYRSAEYCQANVGGVAVMLDAIRASDVSRVVLASSSSVYGSHIARFAESDALRPTSVYGMTKMMQERLLSTLNRDSVFLRLFCVYGPNQSLRNPYSGLVGIMAAALLAGKRPKVFENGAQRRDLVEVSDVARAFALACTEPAWAGPVEIGTSTPTTVLQLIEELTQRLGGEPPEVLHSMRAGDATDVVANPAKAASFGWVPEIGLEEGLDRFCAWAKACPIESRQSLAIRELKERGLLS